MNRFGTIMCGLCVAGLAAISLVSLVRADGGAGGGGIGEGTVTLSVIKGTATEGSSGRGSLAAFRIHSNEVAEVIVDFQWSGTATMGSPFGNGSDTDYENIPDRLSIRPGDNVVVVRVVDDSNVETNETVTLKLLPGDGYTLGDFNPPRTVTIQSNE